MKILKHKVRKPTARAMDIDWRAVLVKPMFTKRIERALPGQMLFSFLGTMAISRHSTPEHRAFAESLLPDARYAAVMPYNDMPETFALPCRVAAANAVDFAWLDMATRNTNPEILMACLDWTRFLCLAGYRDWDFTSPFGRVYCAFRAEFSAGGRSEQFAADAAALDETSPALVAEMQQRLEALGLFVGALDCLPEEPAAIVLPEPANEDTMVSRGAA